MGCEAIEIQAMRCEAIGAAAFLSRCSSFRGSTFTIRLNHWPCFLAFVYIVISSMLKSYPSVGDVALCLGLLGWFVNQLTDIQFSFFLFCGYAGVSLLSPVMHNLWMWRGTGNANFYFATTMVYSCLQIILVVESVGTKNNHDKKLRKLCVGKPQDAKS